MLSYTKAHGSEALSRLLVLMSAMEVLGMGDVLPATTKRCSKCGATKPLDAFTRSPAYRDGHKGQCKPCVAANGGAWKAANPERAKAWYRGGRARANARSQAWYAANKDRARVANAAWVAAHPDEFRAIQHNARARRRAAPGKITRADVAALREASCGLCAYCLAPGKKLAVEHVTALADGGTNTLDNLVMACGPCNSRKGARGVLSMVPQPDRN